MFGWFFKEILYRPLLNILVFGYNLMPVYKDMGIVLIILVVLVEILLTPLRKGVESSEEEQEEIIKELKKAEEIYKDNAIKFQQAKKQIIKKHRKTINLRGFDLLIEAIYFITFWWIFSIGLPQRQWDLLYNFVSHPQEPVNLTFLNLFNLTEVSPMLNLISAVGLFVILFLKNWWKPQKATKEDYLLIIWAPFAAYFISDRLPAGQEFFFTIAEAIYFLRLIFNQLKKVGRKLGLSKISTTGKDFAGDAWKQISGK